MIEEKTTRENLDGLNDEQAAQVEADIKDWMAQRNPPPGPDYSNMTNQQLQDEAYKIEREAKNDGRK